MDDSDAPTPTSQDTRRRRVREYVRGLYLELRRSKYGIPGKNGYRNEHRVDWSPIEDCFLELAEDAEACGHSCDAALDLVVSLGLGAWIERPGEKDRFNPQSEGWLRDRRHQLERLTRDLDWVASEVSSRMRPAAKEQKRNSPRHEVEVVDPAELRIALADVRQALGAAA